MDTLFPLPSIYPSGFSYYPDFISIEEELELINYISYLHLTNFNFHGYEAKRKTASFGMDYSFEGKTLTKGTEIPSALFPIIRKVAEKAGVEKDSIKEILLTEYPIGSVINWHRDAFPFDLIAGISLLSDCRFMLRPYDKAKQNRKSIISFPAKRRSLYIMKDASRMEWEHSIAPVKEVRYSITFRTLKNNT